MLGSDSYLKDLQAPQSSSAPLPTLSMPEGQSAGLAILGTAIGCGKTVCLAGFAAMLSSYGFAIRAIKPFVIGEIDRIEAEIAFISSITKTQTTETPIYIDQNKGLTNSNWRQAVSAISRVPQFTMVELPGAANTPLAFGSQEGVDIKGWLDSTDLAQLLSFPCLLVAGHEPGALEQLSLHGAYIMRTGLRLLGLVTVETSVSDGHEFQARYSREAVELTLLARTGVPYLGCIKHSESISVPDVRQGNLIRMTSAGLEVWEIMKNLNLELPAGA